MSRPRNASTFVIASFLFLLSTSAISQTVYCGAASHSSTNWVPSQGWSWIKEDQYSRYIWQYMYWHAPERVRFFAANPYSTYEPDAFFYNYDGKAYGNAPSGYWDSDLPRPYVDTQQFDSPEEKAITIGSADAHLIAPQRIYYTVTRMTPGGGSSSLVKLSSQIGERRPQNCYSTSCSFACNSGNNYRTVPFQSGYTAPGGRVYWWEWQATTNRPWP